MTNNKNTGFTRIIKAWGYSQQGLMAAFRFEAAFRQELLLCLLLIPVALWLGENNLEKAILIACLFLILIVELLNSAIEAVVDRFGGEHHELSGRAKDIASAAVWMSFLATFVIWVLILI